MSSDHRCVALSLTGPLQSWGFESLYNNRNTPLFPSKSAIAGMICAALGYDRASNAEEVFLAQFAKAHLLSLRIPRILSAGDGVPVSRLTDFHTVQGTRKADGKIKDTHITYRQYLQDASFGVIITADAAFIDLIARAMKNPRWGVWLGRKSCLPSQPVFVGVYEEKEQAVKTLTSGRGLAAFTYQEDAESFEGGHDTIGDVAVSFCSQQKRFAPRRIVVHQREDET